MRLRRSIGMDGTYCSWFDSAEKEKCYHQKKGVEFMTIGERLIEVMTETVVNLLNDGGIQMFNRRY